MAKEIQELLAAKDLLIAKEREEIAGLKQANKYLQECEMLQKELNSKLKDHILEQKASVESLKQKNEESMAEGYACGMI